MPLRSATTSAALSLALLAPSTTLAWPEAKAFVQVEKVRILSHELTLWKRFCNFSKVNIGWVVKYITAKHCVTDNQDGWPDDIVVLDRLPPWSKTGNISDMVTLGVSPHTSWSINWKTLVLTGYLPDITRNTMQPYRFTGTARYDPEVQMAYIGIAADDFKKILRDANRSCQRDDADLGGMSGWAVLDKWGEYFWVISSGTVACTTKRGITIHYPTNQYRIYLSSLQDHLKK